LDLKGLSNQVFNRKNLQPQHTSEPEPGWKRNPRHNPQGNGPERDPNPQSDQRHYQKPTVDKRTTPNSNPAIPYRRQPQKQYTSRQDQIQIYFEKVRKTFIHKRVSKEHRYTKNELSKLIHSVCGPLPQSDFEMVKDKIIEFQTKTILGPEDLHMYSD